MNIYIVQEILLIFIFVIDGFYLILNEVRISYEGINQLFCFDIEFVYADIFLVWEIIAAARRTVTKRFVLFIALAMMKSYRDIILDNRMDFTDIIKFFNGLFSFCTIEFFYF